MINTCAIWGTASYVNSWLSINILVIVGSLLAIAVAYTLSGFFASGWRGKIRGFVRFEMIQLLISIMIIGTLLAFSATACNISSNVSSSLSGRHMDPFAYADYYIGANLLPNGLNLLSNIYATSVSYAVYASVMRNLPSFGVRLAQITGLSKFENPILRTLLTKYDSTLAPGSVINRLCTSGGNTFCQFERTPNLDLGQLYQLFSSLYLDVFSPIILVALGLLFIQFLALPIMQYTAFTIVLPVAIGMRSIAFFGHGLGDASNALIAIAVAFYLIYPMTVAFDSYAIAYVFSANNPAAQYAGTAFTVNQVTPYSFLQTSPATTCTSTPIVCTMQELGSLASVTFSAFPGHDGGLFYTPFTGLIDSIHYYTNLMAQFIFQSILLFALNMAITVGFGVSLYKALKSGLGEAGRFW